MIGRGFIGARRLALQKRDRRLKKLQATIPRYTRQDQKARVQFLSPDQAAEVSGILGNDDPVFRDCIAQNHMVRIATPPDIAGMYSGVTPGFVEPRGHLRRDAFVDEELHPSMPYCGVRHPWPPGRAPAQWVGPGIGRSSQKSGFRNVGVILDQVCDRIAPFETP